MSAMESNSFHLEEDARDILLILFYRTTSSKAYTKGRPILKLSLGLVT